MYCTNCGKQIDDKAVICVKCGCLTDNGAAFKPQEQTNQTAKHNESLGLIAKIFMIVSCVITGLYIIPLCWTVPMTVSLCRKLKNKEPISTSFKVCTLIFCNTIAGILLLCMKDENK